MADEGTRVEGRQCHRSQSEASLPNSLYGGGHVISYIWTVVKP